MVSLKDIEPKSGSWARLKRAVIACAGKAQTAAMARAIEEVCNARLRHGERFHGRRVGLVLCGGNIAPLLLASLIQRGRAGAFFPGVCPDLAVGVRVARIATKRSTIEEYQIMSAAAPSNHDNAAQDPIEEVTKYAPVVIPVAGGILIFLLAFIAVFMA